MKSNLVIRTISGVALVAIILLCVSWNLYSKYLILSLIALGGAWEFLTLLSKNGVKVERLFAVSCAALLLICFFLGYPLWLVVSGVFIVRAAAELYFKNEKPIEGISYEIMATLYTVVPMMLFATFSIQVTILLFVLVWSNDVGAYLVGSLFGKRKLFERISPKKSWEGFFGGLIFTIIIGFAYNEIVLLEWHSYQIFVVSLVASIASVYGDLFESMIKRSLKIKDSGSIIPGHGGFLDRFDALYFAVPACYIIIVIFNVIETTN